MSLPSSSPTSRTCRRERLRALVSEQPAELLQVRPAARGVHDDEVDVLECIDECAGECLPLLDPARVHRKRSAAALRGSDDLVAVRRQHSRGRRVHVGKHCALDAAREQTDACASACPEAGVTVATVAVSAPTRSDLGERPEPSWHRQRSADRRQRERRAHAARVGEKPEQQPADEAIAQRPLDLVLDRRARALDESVVANARGARRHAGHAPEAAVEVLGDRGVERDRSVESGVHEVDAPARRVHLLAPEDVRRAGRQAEPAVDAVVDVLADHAARTP